MREMRRAVGLLTAAALLAVVLALPAWAHHNENHTGGEVCPEAGRVESTIDGDLDGIILEAGTLVCIKGGQTLVTVEADGEATLAELLGTGQNVSHYTVLEAPPTTTTTVPEETTTTEPEETTTTVPEETTTTEPPTVTIPEQGVTPLPPIIPDDQPEAPRGGASEPPVDEGTGTPGAQIAELPFTGPPPAAGLAGLAALLVLSGLGVLARDRARA